MRRYSHKSECGEGDEIIPKPADSPTTWLHVKARLALLDSRTTMLTAASRVYHYGAAHVGAFSVGYVSRDSVKTVLKLTLLVIAQIAHKQFCDALRAYSC